MWNRDLRQAGWAGGLGFGVMVTLMGYGSNLDLRFALLDTTIWLGIYCWTFFFFLTAHMGYNRDLFVKYKKK